MGYYTDADLTTSLKVLDEFESHARTALIVRARGEVLVSSIVTVFKKDPPSIRMKTSAGVR